MKRFKKAMMFTAVLAMVAFTLAACGGGGSTGSSTGGAFKVGMVTDIGGINDNSFNQGAWEGLQKFSKDTGAEVKYLESKSDADYVPNLNQFVQNGYQLIWGIGYMMGDAVKDVATSNPNTHFGIIDAEVDAPNVESVLFAENEGAFLVGVIAGKMTKTGKVGFVGGAEIPVIKRFEAGFVAGVKAANPNAQVLINYTGSFNKPDEGKAAAASLYDQGADIVFHAAGQTGDGVFSEAKERKKQGQDVWVIGVDRDQRDLGPEVTLTSMLKRVDIAVDTISTQVKDGKFEAGVKVLTLADGGVDLPKDNPYVPEDVLKEVEQYKEKIKSGEIQVPTE
ncbi:MAG: BMP family ABC transporter substrate-binding protein [Candidatus Carbobacillus sp.]|nr:BMP family ABC transporter substrate-binding protein [Candidatus Carbobacillus sp.]